MSTTKRRSTTGRWLVRRLRPDFDRLESRTALSATPFDPGFSFDNPNQFDNPVATSPLSVVSTTPANSSTVLRSPTSLVVDFNKPLDGFSVGFTDFELVHVNGDGTTRPMSPSEAQLVESLDPAESSGTQVDLTLSRVLLAGRYQLILKGSNTLMGTDGSWAGSISGDSILSDFTIAPAMTSFQDAVTLPVLGTTVSSVLGNLDLAADPGAVQYYALTLTPGHHWSLGLAIDSQSLGSPLKTTLSLFDTVGRVIATSSNGLQGAPGDPFLFQGLDPGTYYVGVSARGNVPGPDGLYDPSSSAIQNPGATGRGGVYQFQAVANPADQPTQVLGIRIDHADSLSSLPTGLTLQFSGALQLAGLEQPDVPPLVLVDQNETTWGVTPVGYDPVLGQLRVVFNQELPKGKYSLNLTRPASLVDLANEVPVATGLSSGTLAQFAVDTNPSLPPGDLGPLFPGAQHSTASLTKTETVGTQSSLNLRFVVVEPGVYSIAGILPEGMVHFTLTDASGQLLATEATAASSGTTAVTLKSGVYTLNLTNSSGESITFPLSIVHKETIFSELMEGGIAQGAALTLRLVTPQANFGAVLDASLGNSSPILSIPAPPSSAGSSTGATTVLDSITLTGPSPGLAGSGGSQNLSLFHNFGPVGLPMPQTNQISVVGSTTGQGSLALASNTNGLSPGLIGIPEASPGRARAESRGRWLADREIPEEILEPDIVAENQPISTTDAGLLARNPQSRLADDKSLAGADWIERVTTKLVGWFGPTIASSPARMEEVSATPAILAEPGEESELVVEPNVEAASFASPLGVGIVLATFLYRYGKSWRLKIPESLSRPARFLGLSAPRSVFRGPHQAARKSRVAR